MRRPAELVAILAGWASRRLGRGGGTSLPGVILLRLRPRAAADLAEGLTGSRVAISATNGKTTTARLAVAALEASGGRVVANTAGANLLSGVTSALLANSRDTPPATSAVLEVDEAALPAVADQVQPDVIVLMNLFRDQLDRFGELESLVGLWETMLDGLDPATRLVLNADDPAIASLGEGRANVTWFGVDDARHDLGTLGHAVDSDRCRNCESQLVYERVLLGHMGGWRCENCGRTRPTPSVSAVEVDLDGVAGQQVTVDVGGEQVVIESALPGLHNAYNLTAAMAIASAVGLDLAATATALGATGAAFGRGERVMVSDRDTILLLAKNPAGANQNLRTVLLDEEPVHALIMLNDRTADGQDVSWIWDVDYEPLLERAAHITVGGTRAGDLALRFKYAGFPLDQMTICHDPAPALDAAVAAVPQERPLYILPTYTAMLDLRQVLTDRGLTGDFWEDA